MKGKQSMKFTKMSLLTLIAVICLASGSAFAVDTNTVNATDNAGLQGASFVPRLLDTANGRCEVAGTCNGQANLALNGWRTGGYFEPRNGTEFMPPTGDHHRTGYRLMSTLSFGAGLWLTGFGPLLQEGQFTPDTTTAGASENAISMAVFLDHPTSPITAGKFPRYIPHTRDRTPDVLVAKNIASSSLTQDFSSQSTFARTTTTWTTFTDENGNGCGGGLCTWTWNAGGNLTRTDALAVTTIVGPATLSNAPFLVDDRLSQKELASGQSLQINFTAGSGPNVQEETYADPNEFVQCTIASPCASSIALDTNGNPEIPARLVPTYALNRGLAGPSGIVGAADAPALNPATRAGADGLLGHIVRGGEACVIALTCKAGDIIPGADDVGIISCTTLSPCTGGQFKTLRETDNPQNETFLRIPMLHSFGNAKVINQLVQQNLGGYLYSCLGCGTAPAVPNPLPPFFYVGGTVTPLP